MQNDKPIFRGAIGGFNKQDVNEYIASLSENFAKEKAEYEKKLEDLTKLTESLRAEADEINSGNTPDAAIELDRANSLIAAQEQKLVEKQSQIDSLNNTINERDETIAELKNDLERFKDCSEKLREYDLMSQKMGELMLKAASSAEQIKSDAELEAAKTLKISEERSKELLAREEEIARTLETRYTSAVAAINAKLNELVNDGFDTLNASMRSADEEMTVMLEKRRSAAKSAVLRTAESLPELKALAGIKADE